MRGPPVSGSSYRKAGHQDHVSTFVRGRKWTPQKVENHQCKIATTGSDTVDGSEIRRSPVDVVCPIIFMVLYIAGGAGFQPSTVDDDVLRTVS